MSFAAVQERWDAFLSKIEARFHELLQQASTLLPALVEGAGFDTIPFGNAWQGIYQQSQDLVQKIESTWHEKVSDAFDELSDSTQAFRDAVNREMLKGDFLRLKLEKELKRYEVRTYAEAGHKLRRRAREVLAKEFACSQCHAPLPVRDNFFRSYYLTCDYCQRVNTFEPGTVARNVEHFALHPLAEEKALEAYLDYYDKDYKYRRFRKLFPEIDRASVVLSYLKYVEEYLKARIEIIPEYQKDYEKDLEAKMSFLKKYHF